jgi:hypothetical protein
VCYPFPPPFPPLPALHLTIILALTAVCFSCHLPLPFTTNAPPHANAPAMTCTHLPIAIHHPCSALHQCTGDDLHPLCYLPFPTNPPLRANAPAMTCTLSAICHSPPTPHSMLMHWRRPAPLCCLPFNTNPPLCANAPAMTYSLCRTLPPFCFPYATMNSFVEWRVPLSSNEPCPDGIVPVCVPLLKVKPQGGISLHIPHIRDMSPHQTVQRDPLKTASDRSSATDPRFSVRHRLMWQSLCCLPWSPQAQLRKVRSHQALGRYSVLRSKKQARVPGCNERPPTLLRLASPKGLWIHKPHRMTQMLGMWESQSWGPGLPSNRESLNLAPSNASLSVVRLGRCKCGCNR